MARIRNKKSIEDRLAVLERLGAEKAAGREPTWRERMAERDAIVNGLVARLEAVQNGQLEVGDEPIVLTGLALELAEKFAKLHKDLEQNRRRAYLDFLRRAAGAWTKALKPSVEEPDPKVVPISSKLSGSGIGSAFGEVNTPDYDPDYFNLKGPSEASLWE